MKRIAALFGFVLVTAISTAAADNLGSQIGKGTANGQYAAASAGGTARHPRAMYMKVLSSPNRRIQGGYAVTCGKGSGAGSQNHTFRGFTPRTVKLRHPYKHPDVCFIGASAQIQEGGGFLRIKLFAKR